MKLGTQTVRKYHFTAAGHTWLVPEITLTKLPDGSEAISLSEIDRVHRAVTNELCGHPGALTFDELEFLCDVTSTTLTVVADLLGLHKSTVTKWRDGGAVPREVFTTTLKRYFWFRLFGDALNNIQVPLLAAATDQELLTYVHQRALEAELAEPLEKAA